MNIENINISIDSGQFTDKYTADIRGPVELYQYFTMTVGDFPCSFRILDIDADPIAASKITARADLDDWMYELFALEFGAVKNDTVVVNAFGDTQHTSLPNSNEICAILGVTGEYNTFYASNIGLQKINASLNGATPNYVWYMTQQKTAKEIVTSLFSWTSSLPRLKHIILRRNGVTTVYGRAYLPTISNLDDTSKWVIDPKNLKSEIIRTIKGAETAFILNGYSYTTWTVPNNMNDPSSSSGSDTVTTPFNGTEAFGDASITYNDGLITDDWTSTGSATSDSVTTENVETVYTYTTVNGKEVTASKINGKLMVYYSYDTFLGVVYLSSETEYTFDTILDVFVPSKKTIHIPNGNGFWGARVYAGFGSYSNPVWVEESSSVSKGAPGGEASIYSTKLTTDRANAQRGNNYNLTVINTVVANQIKGIPVSGIPTGPDYASTCLIAAEFNWMDGRTQYTDTLDIYNLPGNNHVIDVIEKVTYQGVVWYVDKNTVSVTPKKIVQTVQLVRWA